MEDSLIVIAISKFVRDYSWDKSLSRDSSDSASLPPRSDLDNTSIEDFLKCQQVEEDR